MANQPQPARPWFRLASLPRLPQPAPTAEPRPPVVRPALRPMGQTQPPELGQQPPPPTTGVSSVPTSPVRRTSVPTSPVRRTSVPTSPTTTTTTTSPPRPQVSAPAASPLTSPIRRPAPYNGSVTTSPAKPAPHTASVTTSPAKPAPYTAPVTTSPPKPTSQPITTTETVKTRVPSPPSPTRYPRTTRPSVPTPDQSPKRTPTAPPPSPLSLPPPLLRSRPELEPKIPTEAEPKGVLVQKTIEKPKPWLPGTEPRRDIEETHHRPGIAHPHAKHELPKDAETKKKTIYQKKFSSDSEEAGMRIITIAGDNKGAFMEIIRSPQKGPYTLGNKNGKTKTDGDGSGWHSYSSSGEEGKPKMKDRSHSGKTMVSPQMGAFTNSNVQGVNNSIVYNSSCTHHDPGVHLAFSRKPSDHAFHIKDSGDDH